MRALLLAIVLLAPLSAADGHWPWHEGRFAAGARVAVDGVNAQTIPFAVDQCRRHVLVDVLYEPEETLLVDQEGVGEVALLHTFRLELRSGNATLRAVDVLEPGYGKALGAVPREGAYEVRLVLTQGADIAWQARVRDWPVWEDPACGAGLP